MVDSVHAAELAIFAILVFPTLYCLFRHLPSGFLGWTFLFLFCSLRIVADGLALANPTGEIGIILGNVALSPLLLAAMGIIHEARALKNPRLDAKVEWIFVLAFHMLIGAGVALLAVGLSGLYDPTTSAANDRTFMRVGLGILTASWALICAYCASSFAVGARNAADSRGGFVLLCATLFALVWIGVRVVYTLVAFTTLDPSLNPVTGTLAVRVVLSLLPEILAAVALIVGGVIDLPRGKRITSYADEEYHLAPKSHRRSRS